MIPAAIISFFLGVAVLAERYLNAPLDNPTKAKRAKLFAGLFFLIALAGIGAEAYKSSASSSRLDGISEGQDGITKSQTEQTNLLEKLAEGRGAEFQTEMEKRYPLGYVVFNSGGRGHYHQTSRRVSLDINWEEVQLSANDNIIRVVIPEVDWRFLSPEGNQLGGLESTRMSSNLPRKKGAWRQMITMANVMAILEVQDDDISSPVVSMGLRQLPDERTEPSPQDASPVQ